MMLSLDSEEFRELAQRVTEIAADYLQSLPERPIIPNTSGAETQEAFAGPAPEEGLGVAALDDLQKVAALSRAQNGGFFGYVLGSGEPVGATADLLASVINQNLTAWRSGPAATVIEQTVVGWLAEAIGCPRFTGTLTGGGSLANLMGLAMAREAKAPANEGGATPAIVYASTEVHMSIPKAVALLGLGTESLQLIETDEHFKMSTAALTEAIDQDLAAGRVPIAVVATSGTVNTGAIDPLEEIADVAGRHGLWLHVDGAYGGLAAMARPELFKGLSRADSISLDAHKWLYQSLDCSCLLYRDPKNARRAFSHTGDYAKSLSDDPLEGFAFFEETIELSRRFRGLRLWLSLRYHGLGAFRAAIAENIEQSKRLAQLITDEPDLELLAGVELSAVCFRWRGADEAALDRINQRLLEAINERGRVYLSNATINGKFALRACITNHRTTEDDVRAVVAELKAAVGTIA
ncbi:MAG: pyridoxal-dependent decarboxylase [Actinomycetota bacterium]|nr:pyridoxal-dependent decarboxylase [Actinomycetota bacterium]